MKRLIIILVFASLPIFYFGCSSNSDDNNVVTPPAVDPIVNTWISEGADVAPGLVTTLKTVKIIATFNSDNTYTVIATDSSGAEVTYSGTFTTSENTGITIRSIVLNQSVPTSVTSTGIYEVNSVGQLEYEVIQTDPAITGFTPPVASEGFGSTKYNGIPLGATWIQTFIQQ